MPITITIAEDGPAKRHIIEMAFSEIGAAGYEFGRTPEEVTDALQRLNAMMAEWLTMRGIDLGYIQPPYGVGEADTLSGIPHDAMNTVASYLALRICPIMGATMSGESKGSLARSLYLLEAHYSAVPSMPFAANTPRGAGSEHPSGWTHPFIQETADDLNGTG